MADHGKHSADKLEKAVKKNSGGVGMAARAISSRASRIDRAVDSGSTFSSAPKHYNKK